ncbi:MAG: DUF3795 domain-containing protein [Deltaproteobacteria bacterium]|nr:DUF3795 domain-containing protein [Deltaproteobacteria bacterium]
MKSNDLSDVSYCGFFCKDCWVKKEEFSRSAKDLLNKAKAEELKQLSKGLPQLSPGLKGLSHYDQFIEFLKAACLITCCRNCRGGGGFSTCAIRDCCRQRQLPGCWDCDEYTSCSKISWLEPAHPGAAIKNLDMIRDAGIQNFREGEKYW